MSRWFGKIAVVTGASSGIGASVAEKLVGNGLEVVGIARRKDRLEELSSRFEKEGKSGKLYVYKADVAKDEDIFAAFSWIKDNVGPISILVNNAGLSRKTTVVDGNLEDWRQIIETNFWATAVCSRQALASMMENNIDGHIVNVNSIAGHKVPPSPRLNVYPASKHAVTAFTDTLRQELVRMGSKIKVTSVSPGFVATELFTANKIIKPEVEDEFLKKIPTLQSENVADAILSVLETPPHVQITELTIKPVGEVH